MSRRQTPQQRADHHAARLAAATTQRARLGAAMDWLRAELAAAGPDVAGAYADAATHRLRALAEELSQRNDRGVGAA